MHPRRANTGVASMGEYRRGIHGRIPANKCAVLFAHTVYNDICGPSGEYRQRYTTTRAGEYRRMNAPFLFAPTDAASIKNTMPSNCLAWWKSPWCAAAGANIGT